MWGLSARFGARGGARPCRGQSDVLLVDPPWSRPLAPRLSLPLLEPLNAQIQFRRQKILQKNHMILPRPGLHHISSDGDSGLPVAFFMERTCFLAGGVRERHMKTTALPYGLDREGHTCLFFKRQKGREERKRRRERARERERESWYIINIHVYLVNIQIWSKKSKWKIWFFICLCSTPSLGWFIHSHGFSLCLDCNFSIYTSLPPSSSIYCSFTLWLCLKFIIPENSFAKSSSSRTHCGLTSAPIIQYGDLGTALDFIPFFTYITSCQRILIWTASCTSFLHSSIYVNDFISD